LNPLVSDVYIGDSKIDTLRSSSVQSVRVYKHSTYLNGVCVIDLIISEDVEIQTEIIGIWI